jgi:hypothetical protein
MSKHEPIRIFIGFDRRAPILYHVACHSILSRASAPVSFTPLHLPTLQKAGLFDRPLLENQSTEFALSRFLTPYLAGFEGWAIFMDNDIIARADIAELWALRDDSYAIRCVKHEHVPGNQKKFLGEQQTTYPKKNWSSVMLMNCARCTALTPDYVSTATGLDLHRFNWLGDDSLIGDLPPEWNHLVETSAGDLEDQKMLHYTDGGPYYEAYRDCQWAEEWTGEQARMMQTREVSLLEFEADRR